MSKLVSLAPPQDEAGRDRRRSNPVWSLVDYLLQTCPRETNHGNRQKEWERNALA